MSKKKITYIIPSCTVYKIHTTNILDITSTGSQDIGKGNNKTGTVVNDDDDDAAAKFSCWEDETDY